MLNSEKKFRALCDKKKNILTLVLSEKKILNETKNHNPPFKLNGQSLITGWSVNDNIMTPFLIDFSLTSWPWSTWPKVNL